MNGMKVCLNGEGSKLHGLVGFLEAAYVIGCISWCSSEVLPHAHFVLALEGIGERGVSCL